MRPAQEPEIVVVGAGIVGSAVALGLAQRGLEVTVIERAASVPEVLRGELIMPAGVDVLDRLGVGDALRKVCLETEGLVIHHPAFKGGRCQVDYASAPAPAGCAPGAWRPRALCGWRRPLYEGLRAALHCTPGVRLLEGHDVYRIERRHDGLLQVEVRSHAQPPIVAPMVVAADGRSSRVRKLMGFEPVENRQQTFVQGFVGRARRLAIRHVHVGVHPMGAAFVFPFPDGRFRSTFEFEAGHREALQSERPLESHLKLLRESLPELWTELGGDAIGPLTDLQVHPGHTTLLAGLVDDGFALAGDAAGCLDPFTGYGMSIGLYDAEILVETLVQAAGCYTARALRPYESARQARIPPRREATDQLAYVFLNKSEGFADTYAQRIAARWEEAGWILPMLALQFAGYDLPVEASVGLKHHVFGLL